MEPSEVTDVTTVKPNSVKVGNMILNRFCIDEDAAFELSGVMDLKSSWELRQGIDTALQKVSENEAEELKIHFVYARNHYIIYYGDELRSIILNVMKKYKIKSVMVTNIYIYRRNLITKEKMENYCKGEEKEKHSVNDDLESFLENIRRGKEPDEEVITYFLPKLTEEELELVDRRDTSYLQTFSNLNPDVEEAEMMLSESDSKYVHGVSGRRTFIIENLSKNHSKTTVLYNKYNF